MADRHVCRILRVHQAKQAIGPFVAPLYGDLVARVIAASCGLSRKCLVLDLDNTLWGGVVGDDGIEGLVLGQGSAAGEAYSAFQSFAVSLAERGIVLAVCSKNEEEVVSLSWREASRHGQLTAAGVDRQGCGQVTRLQIQ
jgi:predicted enzyme involved in methoxymalonyl-ACP biosynthesis